MTAHPRLPPSPLTAWAWWDRALHLCALTGDPVCAAIIPERARHRGQRYRPVREGLLWRLPCGTLARIDESGMLASVPGDRALPMPADGLLTLAHPWTLDEAEWAAWQDVAFQHTIIPADWQAPWTITADELDDALCQACWPECPGDALEAEGWQYSEDEWGHDVWLWPAEHRLIEWGGYSSFRPRVPITVPDPINIDGPAFFRAIGSQPPVPFWVATKREGALRDAA